MKPWLTLKTRSTSRMTGLCLLILSSVSACATRFQGFEASQNTEKSPPLERHCKDVQPKECAEKMALFVLFEQTRNIKEIYKDGVFQNDLPREYQAANQVTFRLPYFIFEMGTAWFQTAQIAAMPDFITKYHIIKGEGGRSYFKFPVHPVATEDYKSKLGGVSYRFVEAADSEFLVSPTASERTLIRNLEETDPGGSYMIKVSLPLQINNRPRVVYPTEMKRGIWFSQQLDSYLASAKDFLFFFRDTFGAYPRGEDNALGATVFREFPAEFYASGRRVVPLFSFLAKDETGKPLFMRSMPTEASDEAKWSWFSKQVLEPLLAATRHISYERGMGMQLHSQNLTIELTADLSRSSGRFGYRDLGGSFFDLPGALVKDSALPSFDTIRDLQRELGLAYFKGNSLLDWTHYFLKNQVSDLFAIQMAAHGAITKDVREQWKRAAWDLMVEDYKNSYFGRWSQRVSGLSPSDSLPASHNAFSLIDQKREDPHFLESLLWWKRGNFYLGVDKENTGVYALGLPGSTPSSDFGDLLEPFKIRPLIRASR